ncbi:hypothetical protein ACQP00_29225 [Dactylosporangium sp. CS-047395]|uniref:hypothetical protein n=1 Tax=Dactylosporangium sp. CS-047395 TaxID=3239936 RepID=UPI003D89CE6B
MTTVRTDSGATKRADVASSLAPALRDLRAAALRYAAAKASRTLRDWTDGLNDYVARRGPATRAVFEGLRAKLLGKHPFRAAIKGAWAGMSTELKIAVVLTLVLVLLLGAVVLVVLLLGLLVAVLIAGIRAATR